MAPIEQLVINVDGAARGNPGPAAYGFVFLVDGQDILEQNGYLGETTNNVAEYTALIQALTRAAEFNPSEIVVRSDSELMVKQMNGHYKVKNETLKELHQQARQLAGQFPSVRFSHVFREDNKIADRLCNEALDAAARGRKGTAPAAPSKKPAAVVATPRPVASVQSGKQEAAEYLRVEARGWLKNGIQNLGGETTGVILRSNDVTLELDVSGSLTAAKRVARLDGQLVKVTGDLSMVQGTERQRLVLKVTNIA